MKFEFLLRIFEKNKKKKQQIFALPVPAASDFVLRMLRTQSADDKHRQQLSLWVLQDPIHESVAMVTVSHRLSDFLMGCIFF
jgi:hypothetical protein